MAQEVYASEVGVVGSSSILSTGAIPLYTQRCIDVYHFLLLSEYPLDINPANEKKESCNYLFER